MRKALDEDSGILKGTECGEKSRDDMRRLVGELKTSFVASVGDMRQDLLDRLNETSSDLKIMVREEVAPLRVQVCTMEITLKDLQGALHQGDTRFAVIGTKMDTMQGEIDRVRDTPSSLRPRSRETTTDKIARKSDDGTDKLSKNPFMNIALTALLTAVGTAGGMWALEVFGKGAKVAIQEAGKDDPAGHHKTVPAPHLPALPHTGPTVSGTP
jgi:hypothetical protein